jgi:hypothetical protein
LANGLPTIIVPAGVEPAGVEPAGVEPAGVEPAGVEPAGVEEVLARGATLPVVTGRVLSASSKSVSAERAPNRDLRPARVARPGAMPGQAR